MIIQCPIFNEWFVLFLSHWDDYVVNVSASHAVGREFAPPLCQTEAHHKNGTNCLSAKHTGIIVRIM